METAIDLRRRFKREEKKKIFKGTDYNIDYIKWLELQIIGQNKHLPPSQKQHYQRGWEDCLIVNNLDNRGIKQ